MTSPRPDPDPVYADRFFAVEAAYSDFARSPLGTHGGRELIFVARRT